MISKQIAIHFWQVPTRQVSVNAVHKSSVVTHLRRQWAEKMANPLLMLHVHVEVTNHDDTAIGTNAFLAAAEFTRFHVALHNVYAIFLVEGDAGDFIEAD